MDAKILAVQVWKAFRSGPKTAKAAAAAGFITSSKYKHDAMKTLLHSTQATEDPAAVFAAKDKDTFKFIIHQLARRSQSSFCKTGPPFASAQKLLTAMGLHWPAAEQAGQPAQSAHQLVGRLAECQLSGQNKGAAVITDIGDGVGVRRTNMVSMRKYIEVRCLYTCACARVSMAFAAECLLMCNHSWRDDTQLQGFACWLALLLFTEATQCCYFTTGCSG